jgi:probable phosphomutase (TIGR03848 family)
MTAIYLIRHGENDFVGKRLPGLLPGVHLNAQGQEQALALAEALAPLQFKAVYSSPLERAVQTAAPIAKRHDLQLTTRSGLLEIDIGSWQGKTLKSLQKRKLWYAVQNTPSRFRFPDGESFLDAQARVVREIEELRGMHAGVKDAFVCVAHADVIKLAIAHYIGLPLDLFQRLAVAPASISVLAFHASMVKLVRLNDTSAIQAQQRR